MLHTHTHTHRHHLAHLQHLAYLGIGAHDTHCAPEVQSLGCDARAEWGRLGEEQEGAM